MKKSCKLVTIVCLVMMLCLLGSAAAFAADFTDVSETAWYAGSVDRIVDAGLMGGVSQDSFAPDMTMSRAMLANVLYRHAGSPAVSGTDDFTDTDADAWYSHAVLWAAQEAVIGGYGDGRFGTNDDVSREQIVAMLWRDAGRPAVSGTATFSDAAQVSDFAQTAVVWAQQNGIVSGRGDNQLVPKASATRAEVAAMLCSYLETEHGDNLNTEQEPAVTPQPEEPETEAAAGKTLVVYYSATGSTEAVANVLAEATEADIFELVPAEPYTSEDLNWNDENSRVVYEHDNVSARDVALTATTVEGWDEYDTVFIGYPIWWGIAAWPVDGFVEANDFTGKTVIPFCTSASSGLGESGELLAQLAGTGNWLAGERFSSGASAETVQAWAAGLGL